MEFELNHGHSWDVSTREAIAIQKSLAVHVAYQPLAAPPRTVAGLDVSFRRLAYKEYLAQCGIAVLSLPDLELVDRAQWRGEVTFPYVPGLLSFREIPAVFQALELLRIQPDVFMTDGQGLAHPRRFGLACHLGVMLDTPAFGVAKKRLVGMHEEPGQERGAVTPLFDADEQIGMVVRTRPNVKPVFVSVGHRITLSDAVQLTMACTQRFRIPEPTRIAHQLSRE